MKIKKHRGGSIRWFEWRMNKIEAISEDTMGEKFLKIIQEINLN